MKGVQKSSGSSRWDIPGLQISRTQSGWPRNERQVEFVKRYVMDGEAAERAAVNAGYGEGYARKNAFLLPGRLAECISWLRNYKEGLVDEKLGISAEMVLGEVAALAMTTWQDYLRPVPMYDGTIRYYGKPIDELTPLQSRAVKRFSMTTLYPFKQDVDFPQQMAVAGLEPVVVYEYVLFDRNENLIHMARHFDMFHEKRNKEVPRETAMVDLRDVPAARLEKFLTHWDSLVRNGDEVLDGDFQETSRKGSIQ